MDRRTKHFLKLFFAAAVIACAMSCRKKAAQSNPEPAPTPAPTPTPIPYTDVSRTVSVGAGINFNAATASWSALALNPVTNAPEIVYYDRTAQVSPVAGALKHARMTTAGAWSISLIDTNSPVTAITNTCGGGATSAACIGAPNVAVPATNQAQIFDLKHIVESGTAYPVVAYAHGTGGAAALNTGKSVRFARMNANGKWTVEVAVSGQQVAAATIGAVGPQLATLEYPIKGVRMLVDDSNRVHLMFGVYASTANNSVYLYAMRGTDGAWTAPTVVSTTAPSTLAFVGANPTYAAGTGLLQSGAAWCKYNTGGSSADATGILVSLASTDNAPAASTQGFLLRCAAAAASGACTSWQGLDFVTGCSGNCATTAPVLTAANANQGARSDLNVDPVSGRIFYSYFTSAPTLTNPALSTGIVSVKSPLACDQGLTSGAWSTPRVHPTAAQGVMGFSTANDGTNYYLASLTGATGTSIVVNKLANSLATNWTTTEQVTVEATTNTIAGGLEISPITGVLWGSYGAFAASAAGASGQDIKVFNTIPSEIASTNLTVSTTYVDQTNTVAQNTAVPMLDAAIAPDGNVGYVYFYQEPGTPGPNSHLYYGIRGGSPLAPLFGEKLVGSGITGAGNYMNGLHPSLAYDSVSNPVISFLDQGIAANQGYLMVARSANGGVAFDLDRVDGGNVNTRLVGQYTSVRVSAGDTVGVSYYDYSAGATGQRLKFAKRTKNGAWQKYVVDGPGSSGTGCDTTTGAGIGIYSQFRWTSTGRPIIVYQGVVAGVKTLKLAYATEDETNASYNWKCLAIDTALQGSNARGEGIEFFLDSADNISIAHYDLGVGALRVVHCPVIAGALNCAAAGSSAFVGERLNYVIGGVNSIASKPGIIVNSAGETIVSFHGGADMGIMISKRSVAGEWDTNPEVIEATPTNVGSSYTGHHGVLLLNSSGTYPMLFYRGYENWIKYFSREKN